MGEPIKKKIKDLTKAEAACESCPLDRNRIGCKMDVYNKQYDNQEVELQP